MKPSRFAKRLLAWMLAALMLPPVTAAHAEGDGFQGHTYSPGFTIATPKTCPDCGKFYTGEHACGQVVMLTCKYCGESCEQFTIHQCTYTEPCKTCGKTITPANDTHKCSVTFMLCEACGAQYSPAQGHACPQAEKSCPKCGESYRAYETHHCVAKMALCEVCGSYYDTAYKHTCTDERLLLCDACETVYWKSQGHDCSGGKACILCGGLYHAKEGHVCGGSTKTLCGYCSVELKDGETHTRCGGCGKCFEGDVAKHAGECPARLPCERTVCPYCGNSSAPGEECHVYCAFCGLQEGDREAHEKLCPAQSCEYCGNAYVGDHSDCTHAPQSAVNGEVTVTVDLRAGKSHIRKYSMTGKLGEKYSIESPDKLLEYRYSADGKHYSHYKLDRIEDPNGGKFIDGMRKIDVWYNYMGSLTEAEARTIAQKLPGAGDELRAPDGQPVLPDTELGEEKPDAPVVIPPKETEAAEKASVIVMHADAVTGEAMWFMSFLSCPVGGTIDLPAMEIEGYVLEGYYNSDTGERYGNTYTARTADSVFLVAEYSYVGNGTGEAEPSPTPSAALTDTPTPKPIPTSTPTATPTPTASSTPHTHGKAHPRAYGYAHGKPYSQTYGKAHGKPHPQAFAHADAHAQLLSGDLVLL